MPPELVLANATPEPRVSEAPAVVAVGAALIVMMPA